MISMKDALSYIAERADFFSHLPVIKTGITPRYTTSSTIKAILFDIYGTLLISEAGDIGLSALDQGEDRLFTIELPDGNQEIGFNRIKTILLERVSYHHELVKKQYGEIQYPEVDIITLWSEIFQFLGFRNYNIDNIMSASMDFEILSNKVWLMPGIPSLFKFLRGREFLLGIVSNAQYYTPVLFEYLTGVPLKELGFKEEYSSWSFQKNCGKPDPLIFKDPLDALKKKGIKSHEILYVGNDMLNDIATASSLGLKTALFAGDQRSLRMREEDPRVRGISADYIITELSQLEIILKGSVG